MVVDLAHPDCGLLSPSVVRPLSEQSRHREEGERGEKRGGGRFVEYSCHSAPHYLGVWREGGIHDTQRERKTKAKRHGEGALI